MEKIDIQQAGIYAIICTKNNKQYIGSSVNIKERWKLHIRQLEKNIHGNKYLQRSYNKYGKESLQFKVLAYLENYNIKILRILESLYIEELKPEFNLAGVAMNDYSNKWRNKISKSIKELYKNGYKNPRTDTGKKYDIYDYQLNKIHSKISIREVAKIIQAKDYHYLNNLVRKNIIVMSHRGKYIITPEGTLITKNLLLEYYNSKQAIIAMLCDSLGNTYEHCNIYKISKIRKKVVNSKDFKYIESNVEYSLPGLITLNAVS